MSILVVPTERLDQAIDLTPRPLDRGVLTRHQLLVMPRRAARAQRRSTALTAAALIASVLVLVLGTAS